MLAPGAEQRRCCWHLLLGASLTQGSPGVLLLSFGCFFRSQGLTRWCVVRVNHYGFLRVYVAQGDQLGAL